MGSENLTNEQEPNFDLIKYLASIFKSIGLTGFIVVMLTFIFLVFSTAAQKTAFIDTWILLENVGSNPFPSIMIIVSLCVVLLMTTVYCNKMAKVRKEENNRIGREKSELQELLLSRESN